MRPPPAEGGSASAAAGVAGADDRAAAADPAAVDAAIWSRRSTRAFLPRPVARALIEDLLHIASRAPSGTNTQPWQVYVLQGPAKAALEADVCAAHDAVRDDPSQASRHVESYDYYPQRWVSPFIDRRRENGWSLYGLLGIERGQKDRMHAQHQRNYRFFDAPVGLMFTIDRVLGRGSLLDCGMFLQTLMIAARARGLDTCPQAAWNSYSDIVLRHLGAAPAAMLVCGMALGYGDPHATVNALRTPRVAPAEFATWL